jgi:hypothetical protein
MVTEEVKVEEKAEVDKYDGKALVASSLLKSWLIVTSRQR